MAVGQQCKAELMRISEKGMDRDNIKSKDTDKTEVESQGLTGTHGFVIYYLYPDLIFHMLLLLAIPTRSVSHVTQTLKGLYSSSQPSSCRPALPSS